MLNFKSGIIATALLGAFLLTGCDDNKKLLKARKCCMSAPLV